ncbi:hypothetical protein GKE82_05865 [Conexibacter sp. W3-3-2]|uniref:hypothetical protein n=1 Tax=Conexibacter sp. W3-3-2 TaxID=2675227 RepID=UPI0012B8DE1C|nr:hypothetical protein [Conexibacter sp. W3-3-2]MTD43842.1 hypothetical protein [Conexibacter sp. W3-3-2]
MRSRVHDPNRTLMRAEGNALGAFLLVTVAGLLLVRAGEALRAHRRAVRHELSRARERAIVAEDAAGDLAQKLHEAEVVAAEALERSEHADALVRAFAGKAQTVEEQVRDELGVEPTGPVTTDTAAAEDDPA